MADKDGGRAAVIAAARRVSAETGIAADVLLAVAIVETAAVPLAAFDGRAEPLIRFEGHYFDRLLSPERRSAARAAGLASPKAGAIANPTGQAARWRLLDRAAAIDVEAAFASASWGLGQVMGSHWRRLGYASAQALAAEARRSIDGQVRIMASFLAIGRLHERLERGDHAGFARLYNGPAYRRNGYDGKIERAVAEARRWLAAAPAAQPAVPEAKAAPAGTGAVGWSGVRAGLSILASWFSRRLSISAPTRSFSISTGRSSAFATIPLPSGSTPRSSPP